MSARAAGFRQYGQVAASLLLQPGIWRHALYREAAWQEFNRILAQSLQSLGLRALMLGFLLVAYVLVVVSADMQVALQIFHIALFREGGPLITAILMLLSQGTDNANHLENRRDRGELAWLHGLGLHWPHAIVLPRLLAMMLACAILTGYFQLFALLGAMLANAALGNLDLFEFVQRALPLLQPAAGASFAERVVYAKALEHLGVRDDARTLWRDLARERPDNPALQIYLKASP